MDFVSIKNPVQLPVTRTVIDNAYKVHTGTGELAKTSLRVNEDTIVILYSERALD